MMSTFHLLCLGTQMTSRGIERCGGTEDKLNTTKQWISLDQLCEAECLGQGSALGRYLAFLQINSLVSLVLGIQFTLHKTRGEMMKVLRMLCSRAVTKWLVPHADIATIHNS